MRAVRRRKSLVYLLLLLTILFLGLGLRINMAAKHRFPGGDEPYWLQLAVNLPRWDFMQSRVAEHDLLFERKLPHPEDNRSPLYPILISLFRVFTADPLRAAQALNITAFAGFFLFLSRVIRVRFGRTASLFSAAYLATSFLFIQVDKTAYMDSLLAYGLFISLLYAGSLKSPSTLPCLLWGGFAGLLFLLKTTAIFLIPALVVAIWISSGKSRLRNALLVLAGFFVVGLPWMIRNTAYFGSPFHQFATYVLYVDRFIDLFNFEIQRPSFSGYIQSHGLFHFFVHRPVAGLIATIRDIGFFDHNLCLFLSPAFLLGLYRMRKSGIIKPVAIFSLPFLLFMFYCAPVVWVYRFVMVYYLGFYVLAAIGIGFIVRSPKIRGPKPIWIFLLGVLPLSTMAYPMEFMLSQRGNDWKEDHRARAEIAEIKDLLPDSAVVFSSILTYYIAYHNWNIVVPMECKDWQSMQRLVDSYKVEFAFITTEEKNRLLQDSQNKLFFEPMSAGQQHSLYHLSWK